MRLINILYFLILLAPFPAISKSNGIEYITERYTSPDTSRLSLTVEVFSKPVGDRLAASVRITDIADTGITFSGTSSADGGDQHALLVFQLPKQRTYRIEVGYEDRQYRQFYTTGLAEKDRLPIFLSGVPPVPAPRGPFYTPPRVLKQLSTKQVARLKSELTAFFEAPADRQAGWIFSTKLESLLQKNEAAVRRAAWEAYRKAPIHDTLRRDFESGTVRFGTHVSPYTVKAVGTRPPNGWALFIAMHGGGGTTQEFNDRQWRHMQIYYRDHPEAGGYIYVALRAPDNTWNGFYTGYAYPLIQNLLRQFMLFGDVDPNKKILMGYSHGGYGAFAIGPKMPDYFAAIHSSAAAPADGADPITLRNTVFTTMIGSNDTMYGRYDRIREFTQQIAELRGNRTDIYPVTVQVIADHPHSGLPDRDKIAEMYPNVRNPVPKELTWRMTDRVIRDFFWVHTSDPEAGKDLRATIDDNRVIVTTDLTAADVLLDSRLIDFRKLVTLEYNGKSSTHRLRTSLRTLCETLQQRGDPGLAFTVRLTLPPVSP